MFLGKNQHSVLELRIVLKEEREERKHLFTLHSTAVLEQ